MSVIAAPRARLMRAGATLCLLVLGLLFAATGPVQAHAVLIDSNPYEGAVLAQAPDRITFTFNETIAAVRDGIHVFDARGRAVGSSAAATGSLLEVKVTEPVQTGTLIVVWRIVSDDGHPVSGTLRFSVGAPSAVVAEVDAPSTGADGPPVLLQALRVVGYAALLLTAGLIAFLLLVLPTGAPARARARLVQGARAGAVLTALAWLVTVPVVATYQLGGGARLLGRASTWSAVSATEYLVAAMVALGTIAAVVLVGDGAAARQRMILAGAAAGVAVIAPALTGHTRSTSPAWLMVTVDALHLLAGSIWFGGVVALVLVLGVLAEHKSAAAEALARFSAIAAAVLALLTAAGAVLAWRILGSWSALVDTAYGRLLIAKVLTVLVVVLLAAWNRRVLLPRVQEVTRRSARRTGTAAVTRVATAEAALLGLVLVLTGLLVDRNPDVVTPAAAPVARTTTLGTIEARAIIASPRPGPSALTIELTDASGEPTEGYAAPSATLSSTSLDLGNVTLQNVGPGRYTGQVVFPAAGTWKLQISLRTGEFENPVKPVTFAVKESS